MKGYEIINLKNKIKGSNVSIIKYLITVLDRLIHVPEEIVYILLQLSWT